MPLSGVLLVMPRDTEHHHVIPPLGHKSGTLFKVATFR